MYLNVRQKEKEKPGTSGERDYLSASRERKQGETQTNTAPLLYTLPARAGLAEGREGNERLAKHRRAFFSSWGGKPVSV